MSFVRVVVLLRVPACWSSPLIARLFRMAGFEVTNPHLIALAGGILGAVVGGGL
jgi:hypothetical protein